MSNFYDNLKAKGMLPLFYHADEARAVAIAKACYKGGVRHLEFTNRGLEALKVFHALVEHQSEYPELCLGIGSIVDASHAEAFFEAGVEFMVSPCFDEAVAKVCLERQRPYMPGCMTLTEIHHARKHGAEICKIFPADAAGGPKFIRSVLAPMPDLALMPTGGVTPDEDNLRAWFESGVVCVGMGSQLIGPKFLKGDDLDELSAMVQKTLTLIETIRKETLK